MFKIRTVRPTDFPNLEKFIGENPDIKYSIQNKLVTALQILFPHNLRFIPSIHIASNEKEILGLISLECVSKSNNSWQINEIFVKEDFRKEGIGEELLKYALSIYGSYGIEFFLGEVNAKNFAGLSLFHRCGFRRYAKVLFYHKEVNLETTSTSPQLTSDFIIRTQIKSDLNELEKLELSSIPADLRPALGRSKNYFKNKPNGHVLVDKSRKIIIGWFDFYKHENGDYFIELIISPGWTYLYEQLLNTIIVHCIHVSSDINEDISVTIKVIDYCKEFSEILSKSGYLPIEVRELLVRTMWQKAKERNKQLAQIRFPSTQPVPGS